MAPTKVYLTVRVSLDLPMTPELLDAAVERYESAFLLPGKAQDQRRAAMQSAILTALNHPDARPVTHMSAKNRPVERVSLQEAGSDFCD